MLRIAFVIYGSLDQVSGGYRYDRALVAALRASGHVVDVIGIPARSYPCAVAADVANLARRRAIETARRRLVARSRRRDRAAASVVTASHYDAIIEDELVHPSVFLSHGWSAGVPEGKLRVALVHNLRSNQPSERCAVVKATIERRYLASVNGVVAVCGRTLAEVRALVGRAVPGIVVYPGRDHVAPELDEAAAAARATEPGPLRVLHVAAVQPHKGLARLLSALAAARDQGLDFTLEVVGRLSPSRYLASLRDQIVRTRIRERVQLRGELAGAALEAAFRRAQVFALPSDREAYSLACLEALGFGLPVLATSAGGLAEMVTPGANGFLLAPDDTRAWAAALRDLGADRAALASLARGALGAYRAHGTWREAGAAVEAFIVASRRG